MIIAILIKIAFITTGIITAVLSLFSLVNRNTTPMFSVIWTSFGTILFFTGIFIEPYGWSAVLGIPTLVLLGILAISAIIFLWYLTKKIDELQHKFNESVIQLTLLNNKNEELKNEISNLNALIKSNSQKNKPKNKNILFVNNTLSTGGAETSLIETLTKYSKNNKVYLYIMTGMGELINKIPKEVTILNENFDEESVLTNEGKKKLIKKIAAAEVNSFTGVRLAPYYVRAFATMIRNRKIHAEKFAWRAISDTTPVIPMEFDIAIAYTEGASTYYVADKVAAKHKIAYVHTNYLQAGYTKQLDKNSYDLFNEIYTVSDEVKNAFLQVHPECLNKIKVKAITLPKEKILELSNMPFEDEYWTKIGSSTTKILTVSRLVKLKGYENMIKSASILQEKGYKFVWLALGEGEDRNRLQNLIKKLDLKDNFILKGNIDNPYPYFKNCDIYVHATYYEGNSIAVNEAKMLACPIVLSKTDGNAAQIIDKKSGVYCTTEPKDIANKIEFLIQNKNEAEEYGKKAALIEF